MTFLSRLGSIVCEDSLGSVDEAVHTHTHVYSHTLVRYCVVCTIRHCSQTDLRVV